MNFSAEEAVRLLKQNRIFKNADSAALIEAIDTSADVKSFRRGETIFSPGKDMRALGLILSGSARVKKEQAAISTLEVGDIFGAVTLFSDEGHPATAITARVECKVLLFESDAAERLIKSDPEISRGFAAYLSNRIHFLTRRIALLTAGNCESRLLSFFIDSEIDGEVDILSCADLSRKTDMGRTSLYRALDNLEKMGEIKREGKKIFLTGKN